METSFDETVKFEPVLELTLSDLKKIIIDFIGVVSSEYIEEVRHINEDLIDVFVNSIADSLTE